jgi:uncharacterized membrane protein YeaQ/YmgE (transglycosylase-associated protein family)
MAWIITIIIGGIVGWIASLIMRTRQGIIADIIIGILGSILGVWLFTDVLGIGPIVTPGTISILNIIWGIIGAAILIAVIEAISYDSRSRRRYDDEDIKRRPPRTTRSVAHEYEEDEDEDITIIKKKRRK